MTLVFNPQLENASLDDIRDAIDSGVGAGTIELYDGATLLASLTLPKPSFSNASGGQSFLASPAQGTAIAAGQPKSFKFVTDYGAAVFTGSVPDDLTVDFTPLGAVVVSSFVLTEGVVQAREFASTSSYPYQEPPPELAEVPYIWFDASDPSTFTLDGSDVDGWESKGDYVFTITPLNAAKPTKVGDSVFFDNDTSAVGVSPAMLYGGDFPPGDNGYYWTHFVVISEVIEGSRGQMPAARGISSTSSGNYDYTYLLTTDSTYATGFRNGAVNGNAIVAGPSNFNSKRLLRSDFTPTGLGIDIDGGQYLNFSEVSISHTSLLDRMFIGGERKSSSLYPAAAFGGKVHEVLMYNRVLSTAEINEVNAYLNYKWGIY